MDKFALILGSGFGLYGYLPAIRKSGITTVYLDASYRAKLENRPELRQYHDIVSYRPYDNSLLQHPEGLLVVCRRPCDQLALIQSLRDLPAIKARCIFEKPLGPSPTDSLGLIASLHDMGAPYVINYIFRYTDWFCRLDSTRSYSVEWSFMAHHFSENLINWKRLHKDGGGALRFYGIHLMNLFESYYTPESLVFASGDAPETRFSAHIRLNGRSVDFTVDTASSSPLFRITCLDNGETVVDQPSPFTRDISPNDAHEDARVPYLTRLISGFRSGMVPELSAQYMNTERLLGAIERRLGIV